MKTSQLIKVCGSIVKEESIVPITSHIAEHTVVAEANKPYSDYYGVAPFNMPVKPNSIFLFTAAYYTLEEVLRFARLVDICCTQQLNLAVSVLNFGGEQYPAIRVKNFPDYKMIAKLQLCLAEKGVVFAKKVHLSDSAVIKTTKCFALDPIDDGLYLDHRQNKTGYVAFKKLISDETYAKAINEIRNNTECPLFNVARGAIILGDEITDIVRIYSEHIGIDMLKCIQQKFEEMI